MKNIASPIDFLHVFSRGEKWYLVHPERFKSVRINAYVGANIRNRQKDSGTPLSTETRKTLEDLNWLKPIEAGPKPRDRAKQIPVTAMDLFIAQQCTMKCIYCYGGGGEYGAPGAMSEKTAFQAVDWFWRQKGAAKTLSINFFGGEPLLQFGLLKRVVSRARQLEKGASAQFHFTLATNGTLLTEEMIRYLKENRFKINVGFDGPKEIQDRNRPLGDNNASHETVVPRIRKLIAAMPERVTLRATLWKPGEITPVRKALAAFHPHKYQTQPASPGGHKGKDGQSPTADWRDTVQGIGEAADDFIEAVRDHDVPSLTAIKNWLNFNWLLWIFDPPGRRPPMCPLGKRMVAVSASGDVYPCHRFVGWEEFKIGTVFEEGPVRESYLKATYPEKPECRTCWGKRACNGGCLFDHQVRNGNAFHPSEQYCGMTRSLLETAIHLKHQLTEEERAFLRKKRILVPRYCPMDLF